MMQALSKLHTLHKHPDLHPTGLKDHLNLFDAKYFVMHADYDRRVVRVQRLIDGAGAGPTFVVPFEGVVRMFEADAPKPAARKTGAAA